MDKLEQAMQSENFWIEFAHPSFGQTDFLQKKRDRMMKLRDI